LEITKELACISEERLDVPPLHFGRTACQKASDGLLDPETPVMTTSLSRKIVTLILLRLCWQASMMTGSLCFGKVQKVAVFEEVRKIKREIWPVYTG
jgi:hypothetical protein